MREDAVEIASVPHVAEVMRRHQARPSYLADRPLQVDRELWNDARSELQATLAERGWPLIVDDRMAARGIDNFVCYGIPVVMTDDP